jgi:hypothetical protein
MSEAGEVVREFVDAFNAEDLDRLIGTLTDDIEIQTSRGLIEGHNEARRWATRNPNGYLYQRLVLDEVVEHGVHAVATVRRQWFWRHTGQVGDERQVFYVATMRHGQICRWQPFENRDDAMRAAAIS